MDKESLRYIQERLLTHDPRCRCQRVLQLYLWGLCGWRTQSPIFGRNALKRRRSARASGVFSRTGIGLSLPLGVLLCALPPSARRCFSGTHNALAARASLRISAMTSTGIGTLQAP